MCDLSLVRFAAGREERSMAHPAHMRRVLIVEDDDLLGRILRLTLARRGYTVADA